MTDELVKQSVARAVQRAYDEWAAHGFDANTFQKDEFAALFRYFVGRVCRAGGSQDCVNRA